MLLTEFYPVAAKVGRVKTWEVVNDKYMHVLKKILARNVDLEMYHSDEPMEIYTDWSGDGMGYVVMQAERPLVIGSIVYKNKMKYQGISSFLGEARRIVKALRDLSWMLKGREYKVFTEPRYFTAKVE